MVESHRASQEVFVPISLGSIADVTVPMTAGLTLHPGFWATRRVQVGSARLPMSIRRGEARDMPKSSCLAFGAKTYYRPIEAAIRWGGLMRFERRILETLGQRVLPEPNDFPRWPMLRLFTERIFDALAHSELPYGKTGIVQESQRPSLDDPELIVRHVDLKAWMTRYYPGERPQFLFDGIERELHPAVSLGTLSVLLAEREAAKVQLAELVQLHETLRAAHEALAKDHSNCIADSERERAPGLRSESTYLNIIGGLLTLLLGKSPAGTAYSSFRSMDAVISALLANHEGRPGLSERTLWSKLAQARRHLEASR